MIFKTEIENAFHEGVGVGLDKGKKRSNRQDTGMRI